MILYFRTKRDMNGNTKFLAIDTKAETYAISPQSWISKETPEIKATDRRNIIKQLEKEGFRRVDNM